MKNIAGHIVSANEVLTELGSMDLTKALRAFDEFPWAEELAKVEQTGVFPTLSFAAPDDQNSYINITANEISPNEDRSFMTCTQANLPLWGLALLLIPRSAYRETDEATAERVRDQIRQFFDLNCRGLFHAIRRENKAWA